MVERSQWDGFWLPSDVTVIDRPDLRLTTCPRPSPYLNVVTRTRTPRVAEVVAEAEGHFRGRRGRWLVPDTFDTGPLVGALAEARWAPAEEYEVRTIAVAGWTRAPRLEVHAVTTRERLLDCYAVNDAAFGARAHTEDEIARDLAACVSGARVHRFVAYVDGEPAASAGLTAFPDLGFGLLWAGGAVPALRGRGAYSAVLDARIARARMLGLTTVGLNAKVDTSAPIVARMGFHLSGRMTYWEKEVA